MSSTSNTIALPAKVDFSGININKGVEASDSFIPLVRSFLVGRILFIYRIPFIYIYGFCSMGWTFPVPGGLIVF
jgi:hypothetical protein